MYNHSVGNPIDCNNYVYKSSISTVLEKPLIVLEYWLNKTGEGFHLCNPEN